MTDERTRTLLGWLGKIVTVTVDADTSGNTASLTRAWLPPATSVRGARMPVYLMGCSPIGAS